MSKITWADKVTLDAQPDIARINKVIADDMNEIKNAVNDIDDKKINSSSTNYIKFEDGTMICWGSEKNGTYNLPQEFISEPFVIISSKNSQTTSMHFSQATCTTSTITIVNGYAQENTAWHTDDLVYANYIVIGKWK